MLGVLRTVMVLCAIPVCVVYGLIVLLFNRKRQHAINCMIGLWAVLGSRIAGLRLVIENESYYRQASPAVVLFNHRSAADILIMCMTLKANFTGVAKKEIRNHPFLGPAFAFAGAVFIDRFDREQAIRALQPAVETLRGGLSIAVAPEGTRSVSGRLGEFKKGGFRLAMAARAPIVPLIIRNADAALVPGGIAFRPAEVRVTFCPPIPTDDWSLDDLEARIEAVRRLYLDALESQDQIDE